MGVPDKRANSVCSKQCRAELWAPPCCNWRCPTAPRCWHKEGQTAFNPSLPAAWPHLRTVASNSPPTGCSVPLQSTLQSQRLRNGIFFCVFFCVFSCVFFCVVSCAAAPGLCHSSADTSQVTSPDAEGQSCCSMWRKLHHAGILNPAFHAQGFTGVWVQLWRYQTFILDFTNRQSTIFSPFKELGSFGLSQSLLFAVSSCESLNFSVSYCQHLQIWNNSWRTDTIDIFARPWLFKNREAAHSSFVCPYQCIFCSEMKYNHFTLLQL